MLKVGAGNCTVSLALDVLPSFLPLGTSQVGPPDCEIKSNKQSEDDQFKGKKLIG